MTHPRPGRKSRRRDRLLLPAPIWPHRPRLSVCTRLEGRRGWAAFEEVGREWLAAEGAGSKAPPNALVRAMTHWHADLCARLHWSGARHNRMGRRRRRRADDNEEQIATCESGQPEWRRGGRELNSFAQRPTCAPASRARASPRSSGDCAREVVGEGRRPSRARATAPIRTAALARTRTHAGRAQIGEEKPLALAGADGPTLQEKALECGCWCVRVCASVCARGSPRPRQTKTFHQAEPELHPGPLESPIWWKANRLCVSSAASLSSA